MKNENLIGFTAEELETQTVSVLPDRQLMQTITLLIQGLNVEVETLLATVDLDGLVPELPGLPGVPEV